jgi:hypothetical protein
MASITAPSLTLRSTKGSPLTNAEVDANFSNISTQIALGQTAASYTAADVLAKLVTVDGAGSGLDADLLDGLNSATANTASTIVARDASGNFAAGTITAALAGNATTATDLQATLVVAKGGTGATTASAARTNLGVAYDSDVLAYSASGKALKDLTASNNAVPYFTGTGTASTYSSSAYMRGHMADADAATARTTLGVRLNIDVQAYGAQLSALSSVATGVAVLTGAGTAAGRTITAGAGITVDNGSGVAGNPTINANVTSVQGNTGAVIVSVPVTSVQGATGAVIVTNIGGHAGASPHAHNANNAGHAHNSNNSTHASTSPHAHNAATGWPTHLSQFANNLGNYGNFQPNCRCNC